MFGGIKKEAFRPPFSGRTIRNYFEDILRISSSISLAVATMPALEALAKMTLWVAFRRRLYDVRCAAALSIFSALASSSARRLSSMVTVFLSDMFVPFMWWVSFIKVLNII